MAGYWEKGEWSGIGERSCRLQLKRCGSYGLMTEEFKAKFVIRTTRIHRGDLVIMGVLRIIDESTFLVDTHLPHDVWWHEVQQVDLSDLDTDPIEEHEAQPAGVQLATAPFDAPDLMEEMQELR
ncbi:hypothetical protein L1887_05031 [Cichorium endivia]|nr:hypothetical protein L1887_05031 [Cichorium endivia]